MKIDQLQTLVIRTLWQLREATAAQVRDALKSEREFALTTIGTVLSRLEKKNLVTHSVKGRQYVYKPMVSEAEARRQIISGVVEQLFGGETYELVSYLVKETDFNSNELGELMEMIEKKENR
jgi:BlaI family penicillinase repressor